MYICQWLSRDIDDHSGHIAQALGTAIASMSYDYGLMSVSQVCLKGSRSLRQGYHDTSPTSELVVERGRPIQYTLGSVPGRAYKDSLSVPTCSRHIEV